jgi:hypothetical protein
LGTVTTAVRVRGGRCEVREAILRRESCRAIFIMSEQTNARGSTRPRTRSTGPQLHPVHGACEGSEMSDYGLSKRKREVGEDGEFLRVRHEYSKPGQRGRARPCMRKR